MSGIPSSNPTGDWRREGEIVTINPLADMSRGFVHLLELSEETLRICWEVAKVLVDKVRSTAHDVDVMLTVSIVRNGDDRAVSIEVSSPRKDGIADLLGDGRLSDRDLDWWGAPEEGGPLWLGTVVKDEYARQTDTGMVCGVIVPIP